MLQIKNVSISIKHNFRELVRTFNFVLNPGDRAVFIGEEGCGKSTLLKLIYDEELIADYADWSGEIDRSGIRMSYLSQELSQSEKELGVYEYLSHSADVMREAALLADAASQFQIPLDLLYSDRKVGTLSGGEKVKLQLIRILLEAPDVLLLDEPTNDIDLETIRRLETFILTCGLPVLYVSHDEELIEKTANVIIHMEQVRKKSMPRYTVARMGYRAYLERRADVFSHQEQMARKERAEYRAQQERWQQIYNRVDHEQRVISRADPGGGRLLKKKMKTVKAQQRRFEREAEHMTEFPDMEEAIFFDFTAGAAIPRGKCVLDFLLPQLCAGDRILSRDIKLSVYGPEHIGIIGANGAGKTTLLRRIAEELLPRRDITAGYMPQDYTDRLDMAGTPMAFVSSGHTKEETTRALTYLGSMRYTHEEMLGRISELSGGQKAKLFFLNLEISGCNVLVLDEPTRNFSPLSNPVIRASLKKFGGAIISVSHDRKYLREVCTKIYQLTPDGLREVYEI